MLFGSEILEVIWEWFLGFDELPKVQKASIVLAWRKSKIANWPPILNNCVKAQNFVKNELIPPFQVLIFL